MRLLLAWSLYAVVAAADAPGEVPDPYGLGERLALIDWLRDHRVEVAEGAELETLRARYTETLTAEAATPEAQLAAPADQDSARDAAALELWRKHGRNPAPGSTTDAIREMTTRLDEAAEQLDAAEGERRVERELELARVEPRERAPQPATAPAPRPARHAEKPAALPEIREVQRPRDMLPQTRAFLISPNRSPILLIVCDADLRGVLERVLLRWPADERLAAGVDGAVIIHGHSDGGYFTAGVLAERGAIGGDLTEHLRRNREYYESMAGTRARRPIDLAVMTGCNAGGFNQERELKDGLGYRPLRRVFTAPGSLGALAVSLPAIIAAGTAPYDSAHPLRMRFTTSEQFLGADGKKRQMSCFCVVDDNALDVNDHLRRFTVTRGGITEDP